MATQDLSTSPASPETPFAATEAKEHSTGSVDAPEEPKLISLINGKGKGKARERDTTAYGWVESLLRSREG